MGISQTKTLAKVANHFAKRYSAFQGSFCLLDDERIAKALAKTPVSEVWGIGRQYDEFLRQHKIETALQLGIEDKFIEHYLTSMGLKTVLELRGYACIDLDEAPANKKSIVTSALLVNRFPLLMTCKRQFLNMLLGLQKNCGNKKVWLDC